jgi:hypothetical protein
MISYQCDAAPSDAAPRGASADIVSGRSALDPWLQPKSA